MPCLSPVVHVDEFTTLTCVPGIPQHKGGTMQLLDLQGIIEGAAQGRGRGRHVIAVGLSAGFILSLFDATKYDIQGKLLEKELGSVGIRFNVSHPYIYFNPTQSGGIAFNSMDYCQFSSSREGRASALERTLHFFSVS